MSFFKDKTVLVTGAGGSIGSELCRQLLHTDLARLVAFDSSEFNLYELDRTLDDKRLVPVLGDVSNTVDVDRMFMMFSKIDVIFHAAAYKHVTLCEKNLFAAVRVNVEGTWILADRARLWKVPKFILISTDKAVNPTSVMGRTKRDAEEIVRNANYTTIRLGNVMGTSGSVMPLWREQIRSKQPVTITHSEATRYFLHWTDAGNAIIDAAKLAQGGETFVAAMGEPKNIVDVARSMGATEFKYIGLAPGEKLHEELYNGRQKATEFPTLFRDVA